MNTETLTRIIEETRARLSVANYGEEAQAIAFDHMKKVGADLAEALFTSVMVGPLADIEINLVIPKQLEGLQQSVVDTLAAFGVTDGPFFDRCLEASANGFIDRGAALFSAPCDGGRA